MKFEGPRRRYAPLLAWLVMLALGNAAWAREEPASMDDLFGGPAPQETPPPRVEEAAARPAPPEEPPGSMDDLFGGPAESAAPRLASPVKEGDAPASVDALFDAAPPPAASAAGSAAPMGGKTAEAAPPVTPAARIYGFYRNELGYAFRSPTHWSKFRNMLDLAGTGRTEDGLAWKLGGRLSYDPIYDLTDHYNNAVRDDQRLEFQVREAYLDIPAGDWEFRLGRQHIIWGEMVGLFFADVVSAKDLRELALQDFEILRVPQWAARAEYFSGDFHAEAVWVPYMTYNDIGKPGAEFYPFTPPPGVAIAKERKPAGLDDGALGARVSYLKSGWDLSAFLYSTMDPSAAFARLSPTLYRPTHERIHQLGATLGKDLRDMVLKAEAVYTRDKLYNVSTPTDADGLVKQDVLDAIVGLEWSFPEETRFNVQLYGHWIPDPDGGLLADSSDSGYSLMFSTEALHPKLETKVLFIRSLERNDWLTQLKASWQLDGHWRLALGADLFGGRPGGTFSLFDDKDRIYTEVHYSF